MLSAGDRELGRDQVDAGDFFGDRMLDLEAGVGLDEREAPRARSGAARLDQELDGAEALVLDGARDRHRGGAQPVAQIGRESGRRRDLHQLLVATLDAAVALAEVGHLGAVADDLHFDVARVEPQLFGVEIAAAERRGGFGAAAFEQRLEIGAPAHRAHAAPTAAGDRLEHHLAAVAEAVEEGERLLQRDAAAGAVDHWDAGRDRGRSRPRLVAEDAQHFGSRSDEAQARGGAGLGEVRVLGQEAVAGMDRVAAVLGRDRDDLIDVEIGARAGARERDHLVAPTGVQRRRVVLGVDGDGGEAVLGRGAQDADRDLAAVGDEKLGQGHRELV